MIFCCFGNDATETHGNSETETSRHSETRQDEAGGMRQYARESGDLENENTCGPYIIKSGERRGEDRMWGGKLQLVNDRPRTAALQQSAGGR